MSAGFPAQRGLPVLVSGSRSTGWWAIVLLVLIEIMVFSSLIASYFYLYSVAPEWPPAGTDPPKLLLPSINALILFASAVLAWWADRRLAEDDVPGFRYWSAVGGMMLALFLFLKYVEYSELDYRWHTDAYGSIVWMIAAFHSAHVLTVLLKVFVIQALAWKGFWSSRRRSAVQGAGLYWIFVAAIWIPLFATLYLFPRLI